MIRSCEDIKTLDEFYSFGYFLTRTYDIGLRETSGMRRWSSNNLVDPILFEKLNGK